MERTEEYDCSCMKCCCWMYIESTCVEYRVRVCGYMCAVYPNALRCGSD